MSRAVAIRGEVVNERLVALAEEVKREREVFSRSLERSLRAAISVGQILLRAKEEVPTGDWVRWVEGECGISQYTARAHMRLAVYEQMLPDGLNVSEALDFLKGFPAIDGTERRRGVPVPASVVTEAKRRRRRGDDLGVIASDLGVSKSTIWSWCNPERRSKMDKKRKSAQRQQAKVALREELRCKTERAARKRGGSVAKAYSMTRLLAQEIDRAVAGEEDKETRRHLKLALSDVYQAEREISNALGVDYGAWRYRGAA